jgi:hypothetical protein
VGRSAYDFRAKEQALLFEIFFDQLLGFFDVLAADKLRHEVVVGAVALRSCTIGKPSFWPSAKSSSPYITAVCTMPVPSVVVTKSAGKHNIFFAFVLLATAATCRAAHTLPQQVVGQETRLRLFVPATAARRSCATTKYSPFFSKKTYLISGPTASATLPGSVHGVVVHASMYVFSGKAKFLRIAQLKFNSHRLLSNIFVGVIHRDLCFGERCFAVGQYIKTLRPS